MTNLSGCRRCSFVIWIRSASSSSLVPRTFFSQTATNFPYLSNRLPALHSAYNHSQSTITSAKVGTGNCFSSSRSSATWACTLGDGEKSWLVFGGFAVMWISSSHRLQSSLHSRYDNSHASARARDTMSRTGRPTETKPLPPLYAMTHGGIEAIAADEITRDLGGEVKKTA